MTIEGVELDRAGLQILGRDECLRLLASASVGRVALSVRALPVILPVRFVVDGDCILIRVHAGTTLDAATRDAVVAFEADAGAGTGGPDWSVLVTGVARHVPAGENPTVPGADGLPLWSSDRPDRIVAISTDHVSGRRGFPAE